MKTLLKQWELAEYTLVLNQIGSFGFCDNNTNHGEDSKIVREGRDEKTTRHGEQLLFPPRHLQFQSAHRIPGWIRLQLQRSKVRDIQRMKIDEAVYPIYHGLLALSSLLRMPLKMRLLKSALCAKTSLGTVDTPIHSFTILLRGFDHCVLCRRRIPRQQFAILLDWSEGRKIAITYSISASRPRARPLQAAAAIPRIPSKFHNQTHATSSLTSTST